MGRVKRFLSKRIPPLHRILIVESGDREILEQLLPHYYEHCPEIDLVTCFGSVPKSYGSGNVYRVYEFSGPEARSRLYNELWSRGYAAVGIICAEQPIMTKWKWMLAARLPGKLFVINENRDYFWVDRGNWRLVLHFFLFRAGLSGAEAVQTIGRLLLFPFTVLFLLIYATVVHLGRRIRLASHSRH